MFRWNHIAAVIMSTAMVFSMMPLGVMAADQTDTEESVQLGQPEAEIADAGEYLSAGEWASSSSVDDTDTKTVIRFEEPDSDTAINDGVTGWDIYDTSADSVTVGDPDNTADDDTADSGASVDGTANGGSTNGGAGSAEGSDGMNGDSSSAATDDAGDGTDAAASEEASLISIHGIVEREFVQYAEIDSEDLAGLYFDKADGAAVAAPGSGAGLKGVDRVIYDALREAVEQIAAGECDTGIVKVPIATDAVGLKGMYTAEDLGLEYIYSGSLNPDLASALEKVAPVHYDEIMDCLIADCEGAMFPFSGGVEKPAGNVLPFYASGIGEDLDVYIDGYVEISLEPAEKYADPDTGKFAIDTASVKAARVTTGTAKKAVKRASRTAKKTGPVPATK